MTWRLPSYRAICNGGREVFIPLLGRLEESGFVIVLAFLERFLAIERESEADILVCGTFWIQEAPKVNCIKCSHH